METTNSNRQFSLGVLGAIAGMIAAIVTISAAVLGGFIFIDRTYVSQDGEDFQKWERSLQRRFDAKMEIYREAIEAHLEGLELQNEEAYASLVRKTEEAKFSLLEISAYENEAVKRLSE